MSYLQRLYPQLAPVFPKTENRVYETEMDSKSKHVYKFEIKLMLP